jgi:histidinol dehydrogenase
MRIIETSNTRAIDRLVRRDMAKDPEVEAQAARIIADVRRRGDVALRAWSRRLDKCEPVELSARELRDGWKATPSDVRDAIKAAIRRVRVVSEAQVPRPFVVSPERGVRIEQRIIPLARVGCYVPGGRHPLPSTLIMTVTPAVVAGVTDVTVACPAPAPAVLCAALEAGASRVIRMGGAQAIAALAYGTSRVARVDKIVGPGNAWVAAAKALVARDCPIDVHAGPSEIVVWSDRGHADWIALDLLAQAEHDPDARAIVVTTRASLAADVASAVRRLLPADGPARTSLRRHGAIVVARSRREAIALVDRLAPEHLVVDDGDTVPAGVAAGTVFVGDWSVQAAGDYSTGSNHVLPTGGAARVRGGLSAADFVRAMSVQTLTRAGLGAIGPSALALARAEGLGQHAASIAARLKNDVGQRFAGKTLPDVISLKAGR